MRKYGVRAICLSLLAITGIAQPSAVRADSVSDALAVCAGCHGEDGVPTDASIPAISGQHRAYILNQLHDFKSGRRKSDIMSGIVADLSKTDMEALATHFAAQKWPALKPETAPAADIVAAGKALVDQYNCDGCHQRHFEGDTIRPHLAGQQSDYLLKTMQEFRDGARKNYVTMSSVLKELSDDQLTAVAAYLSTKTAPAKGK